MKGSGPFPNQSSYKKRRAMSTENVTYAFQVAATTGVGLTQFLSEPRFTTFRITGNGSVSAGQVTIERDCAGLNGAERRSLETVLIHKTPAGLVPV
jgi:hypothetical protein